MSNTALILTSDPLLCEICDKNFNDEEEINYHKSIYHNFSNCQFCNKTYANGFERDIHEAHVHLPFICYYCNEYFINYKIANDHILKVHDCKICDFCSKKIYPKEKYLEHLSCEHKIKSTIHYNSEKATYLILDPKDEFGFHCKLCYENLPIIFFYIHYKDNHDIKIHILLNIINKMDIRDYVKNMLDFLGTEIKNGNSNYRPRIREKTEHIKPEFNSDICNVCNHVYSFNTPKELHDIFCSGKYYCEECFISFDTLKEMRKHTQKKHIKYCPLGCNNLDLRNANLDDHCNDFHGIVPCKYCGLFLTGIEKYLEEHLKNVHEYKANMACYSQNLLFNISDDVMYCNLCQEVLSNDIYNLEKIVHHYLSCHNFNLKSISKLLVKNSLKHQSIEEEDEDLSDNKEEKISKKNENSLDAGNDNVGIKEEILSDDDDLNENLSTINENFENSYEENSNVQMDEYDMNGHNDINFSEVQCIFSDTSDDAMSDIETSSKTDFEENSTRLFSLEDDIRNNSLFKRIYMECEVCLTGFEKQDKYAKHLQRLHGFKCGDEIEFDANIQDNNESSKYIKVLIKAKKQFYLCLVCKEENSSKTSARKHLRTHNFWLSENCDSYDIGYKCYFCNNLFWTIENRNEHQMEKHSSSNKSIKFMKCFLCTMVFSSKTCLKRHVKIKHKSIQKFASTSYKCMHCYKLYPNLEIIRNHFKNDHPDSKSLYCSISECRTKCSSKKILRNHYKNVHIARQSSQQPTCETCGKTFKNLRCKQLHIKMKHVNKMRSGFKCRVCDERFETSEKRKQHTETIHPGMATFFCQYCEKGFRSKSGLNSHRQTHRKITLVCPECQKTFSRRDSYVEHMLIHNGPRHKCDQCEREFVQRSNLIRHKRIHTGVKPYFCRYCYKRFADKSACNSHERVHTREEVCACPYCNQVFSKKQKLKYHIRIHTGQGLLPCELCQKTFTSPYSLKKHMEVHERQANLFKKEQEKHIDHNKPSENNLESFNISPM